MKYLSSVVASFLLFAMPIFINGQEASADSNNDEILEFETMVGVDGPFLRDFNNPIRGIEGGGLPWVLDEAEGELKANGELEIEVKGLIIPESSGLGFNPAPFFLAAVSCVTNDGETEVKIVNLFTEQGDTEMIGDPTNGDARIRAEIDLPDPCVAPIIFVTAPSGAWFSATGN